MQVLDGAEDRRKELSIRGSLVTAGHWKELPDVAQKEFIFLSKPEAGLVSQVHKGPEGGIFFDDRDAKWTHNKPDFMILHYKS